jgi:hypothetical protein
MSIIALATRCSSQKHNQSESTDGAISVLSAAGKLLPLADLGGVQKALSGGILLYRPKQAVDTCLHASKPTAAAA